MSGILRQLITKMIQKGQPLLYHEGFCISMGKSQVHTTRMIRAQSDRLIASNLDNMTREEVQTIALSDLENAADNTKSI